MLCRLLSDGGGDSTSRKVFNLPICSQGAHSSRFAMSTRTVRRGRSSAGDACAGARMHHGPADPYRGALFHML